MHFVRHSLAGALALGLAALAAPAAAQPLQRTNPPGHFTPSVYTHVVRAGKLLFVAGQIGFDAQAKLVGPGMNEQMEQTLKNLKTVLASQGADFSQIAKVTIFVTSIDEYRAPEAQASWKKYFGDAKPASTLVQVVRLADPAIKIEIEAIAALP